jgi:hypothetical protein
MKNPFYIKIAYSFYPDTIEICSYLKIKQNRTDVLDQLKGTEEYNKYSKPVLKQMELFAAKCVIYINKKEKSIYLGNFYNYIQKFKQNFEPELVEQTKGSGLFLLLVALQDACKENYIDKNSKISLDASGDIQGKDMIFLIKYYESLGFKLVNPFNSSNYIHPMISTVDVVLQASKNKIVLPPFLQEVEQMIT